MTGAVAPEMAIDSTPLILGMNFNRSTIKWRRTGNEKMDE
jgi:hypothetical protein